MTRKRLIPHHNDPVPGESRVFGKSKDPTSEWPSAGLPPTLDLARHGVGPLRLGDSFDAAKPLGRPKRLRGSASEGNLVLEYSSFDLEFQDGRLICAKFVLADRESVNVGDIRLSRSTKPVDAQVWFGEPSSDSTGGGDLRWMDFVRDGATLALEFDAKGLDCVQLYADGYA